MKTFKEAIDRIVSSELNGPLRTYNLARFRALISQLSPFMPLDNEQVECIFAHLDKENQNLISNEVIKELLTNLSEVPLENNQESEEKETKTTQRASIAFDKSTKMFRASSANFSGEGLAKIDHELIMGMNFQKLADLKHLMQLVLSDSAESAFNASLLTDALQDLRLSITSEEVHGITRPLRNSRGLVSIKTMSSAITEIEKRLMNEMVEEGQEAEATRSIFVQDISGVRLDQKQLEIVLEDEKEQNRESMDWGLDAEEILSETLNFPQMESEILKPLGQICEGLSASKTKSQTVARTMVSLMSFIGKVDKFLHKVDSVQQNQSSRLRELIAKEEILKSRIASLEADSVRDAQVISAVMQENENMLSEIQAYLARRSVHLGGNNDGAFKRLEIDLENEKNERRTVEIQLNQKENELSLLRGEVSRLQITCMEIQEQKRSTKSLMNWETPGQENEEQIKAFNFLILEEKEKQMEMLRERINQLENELLKVKIEVSNKNEIIEKLNLEVEKLSKKAETPLVSSIKSPGFFQSPEKKTKEANSMLQRISVYSGRQQLQGPSINRAFNFQATPIPTHENNKRSGNESLKEENQEDSEKIRQLNGGTGNPESEFNSIRSLSNSMNRPEGIQEPLNELVFYARDYLDLCSKAEVIKELKSHSESLNKSEIFSEVMFRFNRENEKERRLMLITKSAFYSIYPKKYRLIRKIPLENILKVTIAENSALLCAIHVSKGFDYLIETFKRADFIVFLMKVIKLRGLPSLKVDYQSGFLIKGSDKRSKSISKMDQSQLQEHMASIYKNSIYYGLINRKESGMLFGHHFKEYFGVLSNLGLLLFKHAGDQENGLLVPIQGSVIVENPSKSYGRRFAVAIMFNMGKSKKEIFTFESEAAKKAWCDAFRKAGRSEKEEE